MLGLQAQLRDFVGPLPSDPSLASALRQAAGDLQVAANIILDSPTMPSQRSFSAARVQQSRKRLRLSGSKSRTGVPAAKRATTLAQRPAPASQPDSRGPSVFFELTLEPKQFKTGSFGWTCSQTMPVRTGKDVVSTRTTCNAIVANSKAGSKKACAVSSNVFLKNARPWTLKLEGKPHTFKSGKVGWMASQKLARNVGGVDVCVSVTLNSVALNSDASQSKAAQDSWNKGGSQTSLRCGPQESSTVPSYWSRLARNGKVLAQGWRVEPVSSHEKNALAGCLFTRENFGGADHQTKKINYSKLSFVCAWRLENTALWGKYQYAMEQIKSDLKVIGHRTSNLIVRQDLFNATRKLPATLDRTVNEVFLLHGTSPAVILSVFHNGINERYSGSSAGTVFGEGSYLCEDASKADQYVEPDPKFNADSELHKRLFIACHERHEGNLCYLFVVRTTMGAFAMTQDGASIQGKPGQHVFALDGQSRRELANIPGTNPPVTFHGLLVNTGPNHTRFKEFVQFHGDRCYPEYLVAFRRV